jgi:hypothetical protein
MAEWTTAQVQDRLELAADVFARLPGVKPQGYFNAWPEYFHSFGDQVGQEPQMRRPRPSPRDITEAEEALLWLRWLEKDDARIVWLRANRQAVEEDLLGGRAEPPGRQPPLAVRHRADHLAAQRTGAILEALAALRGRERRPAVKENRHVSEFSGRHDRVPNPAWRLKRMLGGAARNIASVQGFDFLGVHPASESTREAE